MAGLRQYGWASQLSKQTLSSLRVVTVSHHAACLQFPAIVAMSITDAYIFDYFANPHTQAICH